MTIPSPSAAVARWRARWGGIAPLLLAEFIVWLGFGGLLPVLSIYFTEQGIDFATLGLVIAAWPAARLIGEPIFGWLADRTARVPLMVAGLLLAAVFTVLPLAITGPVAFIVLRAVVGLATAIYDPAARGYLTDATPPERRGEAFGCTGRRRWAVSCSAPRSGRSGPIGSAASASSSCSPAWRRRWPRSRSPCACARSAPGRIRRRVLDATEFPPDSPSTSRRAAAAVAADRGLLVPPGAPGRLLNRGLVAALVLNLGGNFAAGTYDVIWSLFLQGLGAGLGLIGLTFAMFGLPILVLSPMAGRLVDRRGSFAFIVLGSILPGGHRVPLHAPVRPDPGHPADPHRGDRLRAPQPGAVRGRRRQFAAGPLVDGTGPVRRGRDGRVHRGLAGRRASSPPRTSCTRSTCSAWSWRPAWSSGCWSAGRGCGSAPEAVIDRAPAAEVVTPG